MYKKIPSKHLFLKSKCLVFFLSVFEEKSRVLLVVFHHLAHFSTCFVKHTSAYA